MSSFGNSLGGMLRFILKPLVISAATAYYVGTGALGAATALLVWWLL